MRNGGEERLQRGVQERSRGTEGSRGYRGEYRRVEKRRGAEVTEGSTGEELRNGGEERLQRGVQERSRGTEGSRGYRGEYRRGRGKHFHFRKARPI